VALLGRIDPSLLTVVPSGTPAPTTRTVHLVVEDGLEVLLPLAELVDREKEAARLRKQANKLIADVAQLESRLASTGFVDKAPAARVAEVRVALADRKEQLAAVQRSIDDL